MIFSELKGSAVTELVMAWLKTKGSLTCGRWVWQPHGHSRSGHGGLHHHLQPPWTRLFRRSHSWDGWGASLLHLVDSKTQFSQVLFVLSGKARAGFAVPAFLGSTEVPPSHAISKCAHKKRWRRPDLLAELSLLWGRNQRPRVRRIISLLPMLFRLIWEWHQKAKVRNASSEGEVRDSRC